MQAIRIMANLRVPDVEAAKSFYTDYLGLTLA
jgi:catechol 2,3-dioxygenase-like lactoylglutathione lyase family enzyme